MLLVFWHVAQFQFLAKNINSTKATDITNDNILLSSLTSMSKLTRLLLHRQFASQPFNGRLLCCLGYTCLALWHIIAQEQEDSPVPHIFCTNDCMPHYHCLHHTIFIDIMFTSTQSRHGNNWAQIFCSDYGWSCTYPMRTRGKVHDSLSLNFQCKGTPPLMVMDCSKEQTLGEFSQKI